MQPRIAIRFLVRARRDPAVVADRPEGGRGGDGHGGGLHVREAARLRRQLVLGGADGAGESAVGDAVDVVARPELRHVPADRLDLAGEVPAADGAPRTAKPEPGPGPDPPDHGRQAPREVQVIWLAEAAWTRTSTSSSPTTGLSTSRSSSASGAPYLSWAMAFTIVSRSGVGGRRQRASTTG